jgi:hypothetical protein
LVSKDATKDAHSVLPKLKPMPIKTSPEMITARGMEIAATPTIMHAVPANSKTVDLID